MSMDAVFRALADPVRRQLLDRLHARNGQTLGELCEGQDMTRQAVTKHLAILEAANLVATQWRGREKLHFINPLTTSEFMKKYWFGMNIETDWKVGSPWKLIFPDGRIADAGEIVEFDRPRRIVLKWRNQFRPELSAEGSARCSIELWPQDGAVKLTISHTIERADSKLIEAVSGGWSRILSNLKSLLETGEIVLS
jgi:DNA-binding transcriptional ArsR family regulator